MAKPTKENIPDYAEVLPDYAEELPAQAAPDARVHRQNARRMQSSIDADAAEEKRIQDLGPVGEGQAFGENFAHSVTFGLGDEAAGLGAGLGAAYAGEPFMENYNQGQHEYIDHLNALKADSPMASWAGDTAGMLVPIPGGVAKKGATVLQRIGRGVATGAGAGALHGVGRANDETGDASATDRAANGVVGAGMGAALGLGMGAIGIPGAVKRGELYNPLTRVKEAAQELSPNWVNRGVAAAKKMLEPRNPTTPMHDMVGPSVVGDGPGITPATVGTPESPPPQGLLEWLNARNSPRPKMAEPVEGVSVPEHEPVMNVERPGQPPEPIMADLVGNDNQSMLNLDELHNDWVNQQTSVDPVREPTRSDHPADLFDGIPEPVKPAGGWPQAPRRGEAVPIRKRTMVMGAGDSEPGFGTQHEPRGASSDAAFPNPDGTPRTGPDPVPPPPSGPHPNGLKAWTPEPDFSDPMERLNQSSEEMPEFSQSAESAVGFKKGRPAPPRSDHAASDAARAAEGPLYTPSEVNARMKNFLAGGTNQPKARAPEVSPAKPLDLKGLKDDPYLKSFAGKTPETKETFRREGKAPAVEGGLSPRDMSAYVADARTPAEKVGMLFNELGVQNRETLRKIAGFQSVAEVEQVLRSLQGPKAPATPKTPGRPPRGPKGPKRG